MGLRLESGAAGAVPSCTVGAETKLGKLPVEAPAGPSLRTRTPDPLRNGSMHLAQFFDPESSTYTYLLGDENTGLAVLIDPVVDRVEHDLAALAAGGWALLFTLETHVHADHITGARKLKEATGCATVIGRQASLVCADRLVGHGDRIVFGEGSIEVRETPGHTEGCVTYVAEALQAVFTGDALLIDGCGRTDFQGGSASTLFRSIHEQIFSLPGHYRHFPGHDYKGRTSSTIAHEREHNSRLGGGRSMRSFVDLMAKLALPYPRNIDTSLPANQQCGCLPEPGAGTPGGLP